MMKILVILWILFLFIVKKFLSWGLDIFNFNSKEKVRDYIWLKVGFFFKVIIIWFL